MNIPKLMQPSYPITTPRNEGQFYATLRRYTERLKQQRDISLSYLNRINELQNQMKYKDSQIDRLNRVNKELSDKLSLYTSVIERSQPKRSMRMSMLLGKNGMTESIIQTKQQSQANFDPKSFEQFFIIDLADAQKGTAKFRLNFQTSNTEQHTAILDLFVNNSTSAWNLQPVNQYNSEPSTHFVMYLMNSQMTTKSNGKAKHMNIVEQLNPSYYYFVICMIVKEMIIINGNYFWIPVAYGFVTLLPFPDMYFRLLQQLGNQLKIKSQLQQKKLLDSLNQLANCPVQILSQYRYFFINKLMYWKIPDFSNVDAFALIFSISAIQKFALELIVDILILLLLQIPITLISQDEILLGQFMFYFLYIIKPLKYPYPIVFNISDKLITLLQSPFPTFTGCSSYKLVQPFINERAVFDLDKKVAKSWPMLDHLDVPRDFLMKAASRIGNYNKFSLLTQEIIKGHQYRQLEPYWKDFTKTQLYQNYIHKL